MLGVEGWFAQTGTKRTGLDGRRQKDVIQFVRDGRFGAEGKSLGLSSFLPRLFSGDRSPSCVFDPCFQVTPTSRIVRIDGQLRGG